MKKLISALFFLSALSFFSQTITTVAGNGFTGYSGDGGSAITSSIYSPIGIAVDGSGNLYISDQANNRIRKVNTSGIISTIAGNGIGGFSGDGGPANSAQLTNPWGIAIDGSGNLYIADFTGSRVRMVNSVGIISTIAGNGSSGYGGDNGPATSAVLANPSDVAVDAAGNVYITDTYNDRIRKVNTSGVITTIAGTSLGGYSGDGGLATAAEISNPSGIEIDATGNIYFTDSGNNVVRKINTSGIITTVAGNGNPFYSGDGGSATSAAMNGPIGIALDQIGNLYIGDTFNQRVRMVNTSGIITTIAGDGTQGFSGDGGFANLAQLSLPGGLAIDAVGNVFVADENNNRIRKISSLVGINELEKQNELSVYPNPCDDYLMINLKGGEFTDLKIKDVLGREIYFQKINSNKDNLELNLEDLSKGIYFVEINNAKKKLVNKIIRD
jgi:sugar lactone lactonase YvrE